MVRSIATQRRRAYYIPAPRRAIALNDRMRYIVERTYRRRFLTAEHILALIGALGESVQQTRRDLRDLADWGLLMRIRSPHKRRPNAGSTPLIYGITSAGVKVLVDEGRIPPDHRDWTRRNTEVNDPKSGKGIKVIPHALLVSSIMIDIEVAVLRSRGAVRLIEAHDMRNTIVPESTRRKPRPFVWEVFMPYPHRRVRDGEEQVTIGERRIGLDPDQVFGLELTALPEGRNRLFFFLECDTTKMPVTRSDTEQTAFYKKLLGYSATWAQGLHTSLFNLKSFQVLVVTLTRSHVETLAQAFTQIEEQVMPLWDKRCEARVFRFADRASCLPSRLLRYDWVNGHGMPSPLASIPEEL